MRIINNLTNDASQSLRIILEDGSALNLTLTYMENQSGWFYSLVWNSFIINNRRLVVGMNLLRQFRDIIPWGLACTSEDGEEPVFINDFVSGRIKFFTLSESDITAVEAFIPNYV